MSEIKLFLIILFVLKRNLKGDKLWMDRQSKINKIFKKPNRKINCKNCYFDLVRSFNSVIL